MKPRTRDALQLLGCALLLAAWAYLAFIAKPRPEVRAEARAKRVAAEVKARLGSGR